MSAGVSSDVQCSESPTGLHSWLAISVQHGVIVGVDSTGAPVFVPDDTVGFAIDSPCLAQGYVCDHCSEPWIAASPAS